MTSPNTAVRILELIDSVSALVLRFGSLSLWFRSTVNRISGGPLVVNVVGVVVVGGGFFLSKLTRYQQWSRPLTFVPW